MTELRKRRIQDSFTLLELMVVAAVVGILAACAVPQHQVYVDQWAENLQSVGELKQAIAECVRNQGGSLTTPMECDRLAGLIRGGYLPTGWVNPTPRFASAAVVIVPGTGEIVIAGNAQAGNCTVGLTPVVSAEKIVSTWTVANRAGGCTRLQTGVGA